MWRDLPLKWKLSICVIPFITLFLFLAINSNNALYSVSTSTELAAEYDHLQNVFLLREIDHLVWVQALLVHVLTENKEQLSLQTNPKLCAFGKWFSGEERQHAENLVPKLKPILQQLEDPHETLHTSAIKINDAITQADYTTAVQIVREVSIPALRVVLTGLNDGTKIIDEERASVTAKASAERKRAIVSNWVAMAFGLVFSLICVGTLMRSILVPLGKVLVFAKALEQGEVEAKLRIRRRDEFGILADSFTAIAKNLGNQLAYVQEIMDSLPVPTAVFTPDNKLTYCNQTMLSLLDLDGSAATYYGQTSAEFLLHDTLQETCAMHTLKTHERSSRELEIASRKGKSRFIISQSAPLFEVGSKDTLMGVLVTWADTTEMQLRAKEVADSRHTILEMAQATNVVAENVAATAQQLSAKIQQAASGSRVQSHRVEETSMAMAEMNAATNDISRSSSEVSLISHETAEKAKEGNTLVAHVVSAMRAIEGVARDLDIAMADLKKRADDVGSVINVISDIADQTNLLALNAAIEAARAGEMGRGFAVVADEVRKLAEKTMHATSGVVQVVEAIQKGAHYGASNVQQTAAAIVETTSLAAKSGDCLEEIVRMAEKVAQRMDSIVAAASQQAASSESITVALGDVSSVVHQTAAMMEESSGATNALVHEADTLHDLVKKLR